MTPILSTLGREDFGGRESGAPATDEDLAGRACADQSTPEARAAASDLFGRYLRRVYLWCHRYVRDHERALDMSQDVFLLAYRKLPTFHGQGTFASWLFAIARNRCLNELKGPASRRGENPGVDLLVDPGDPPDRAAERRQDEERLLRTIERALDPVEQRAMWLRYVEGMSVADITRILSVQTRSGARGLLQSARRKLRAARLRDEQGS